ncbi:ABC transporter permease [Halobacteriaceae archaeon SHR40]|uniref:ABC transporter permease n=1 Tax=Halovenus amylolytica TaxID=2500550 RepID=UPI000FE3B21A
MLSPRIRRSLVRQFRESAMAKIGVVLILLIVIVAVFAPFLAPHDPTAQDLDVSQQPPVGFGSTSTEEVPVQENGSVVIEDGNIVTEERTVTENTSWSHALGTDGNGRDVLSRVIYGARTSMIVGIAGTLLAAVFGVVVGLTAGYYGGRVEDTLMRASDIMLAFPSLVLAIALVGVWGTAGIKIPDPLVVSGLSETIRSALGLAVGMPETITVPGTVIIVVALVNWVWFARVARGEALSLRGQEYVKAARAVGANNSYIIRKHVFPNAITPIMVLATIQVAAIILLESALSFLGFSGTNLSWGFDISQGRQFQSTSWWIATMPGLAIVLTVIGLNLVGDWLRDALDPDIGGEGGV